ncbi:DEKNAAC105648 [Brettanomyces naardenensis]|uniref:DEKNAAC105648 n=1 Tax=Brettanomyces naardenensis TaxID=13370 RepID=A0A448YTX7_BRENA|nr:DEKNAAC105648 [Brettanomyces naardenensis]
MHFPFSFKKEQTAVVSEDSSSEGSTTEHDMAEAIEMNNTHDSSYGVTGLAADNLVVTSGGDSSTPISRTTTTNSALSIASDIGRVPTNKSFLYVDPEQRPPVFKSTFREVVCVIFCTFAPAAAVMASTCFQTSLLVTSDFFNIQGGQLTWIVNSVVLANGACLLLMGGVADALGRRNSLLIGYFSYALFSLICGFMNNFILLCLFRAFMGASVACATPAAAGFLSSTYKDSKRKNMAMSMFAIGAPVGGACGFFIAGVCIAALNWRAVQFFLTILFGILAIGVALYMPQDETRMNWSRAKQIFKHLDYGGSFLSLAAFTLICFSLTQVDAAPDRWRTPYIPALLVVGIVLIPIFVVYEIYIPSQPIMPMVLYKSYNFDLCMIIAGLSFLNFQGMLNYYSVFYFEIIRGYSAIITACCMLPQPIAGMCVNIFAGLTMHKISGRILTMIGCLGFLTATIIWGTLPMERNYFLGPFFACCVCVIGADLIYNVSNRCCLNLVAKEYQSRAASTFNTIINLASSLGLGISSTIVTSKYPPYGTAQQGENLQELWHAVKYVYFFGIALEGTCLILSFFLKIGVVGANPATDSEKEVAGK